MRTALVCLLLVAAPGLAGAEDKRAARELYQTALERYHAGEYPAALLGFEAAQRASENPLFLFMIAESHHRLGHAGEAARAYQKYLEQRPDAPDGERIRALIAQLDRTPPTGAAAARLRNLRAIGITFTTIGIVNLAVCLALVGAYHAGAADAMGSPGYFAIIGTGAMTLASLGVGVPLWGHAHDAARPKPVALQLSPGGFALRF